jgi:hypothetical protein
MRIRTDGDNAHREDTIEAAANHFDCNKTRAVLLSCEIATDVVPQLVAALDEADIRPSEKEKIVDALNPRHLSVEFDEDSVSASVGE